MGGGAQKGTQQNVLFEEAWENELQEHLISILDR